MESLNNIDPKYQKWVDDAIARGWIHTIYSLRDKFSVACPRCKRLHQPSETEPVKCFNSECGFEQDSIDKDDMESSNKKKPYEKPTVRASTSEEIEAVKNLELLTKESAELQLAQHCYCNCNKCFRARNFIANANVNGAKISATEPKYPLLAAIHNTCEKLGM